MKIVSLSGWGVDDQSTVRDFWQPCGHPVLTGCGAQALLDVGFTAFFASCQCPGIAIRAAMDRALQQARAQQPVVSGFHSPLEQSVLKVLLARTLAGAKLPPEWRGALEKGHLAVVDAAPTVRRLTQQRAAERNALVGPLAHSMVVAHASSAGSLAAQVALWRQVGRPVQELAPV